VYAPAACNIFFRFDFVLLQARGWKLANDAATGWKWP